MKKRTNIVFIAVILLLICSLAVCGVTIHKKNKLISDGKQSTSQSESAIKDQNDRIAQLEDELEKSRSENEKIKAEKDKLKSEKDSLQKENNNLKKEIENLKKKKQQQAQAAVKKDNTDNKGTTVSTASKPAAVVSPNAKKVCYLTFDDGPSPRTTEILKILKKYDVKATFFVINTSNINYLKNIKSEGHAIGLHSYTHKYEKVYKSIDAYFDDLNKISAKVKSVVGTEPDIIRFPGGSSNTVSEKYCKGIMTKLTKQVTEKGYAYFDWNVSSGDAEYPPANAKQIVNNVLSGAKSKTSICVLMHDAQAKTATVQALPQVIEGLAKNGFRFETLNSKINNFHHHVNN